MASELVYDLVEARIRDFWEAVSGMPAQRVRWENDKFSPPAPTEHWISVHFTGDLYGQQTIGARTQEENRWDEEGTLVVYIMAPQGVGSREARRLAKAMADLFRGQQLGADEELEFMDAFIGEGEKTPDEENGNWWRLRLAIDWRRIGE